MGQVLRVVYWAGPLCTQAERDWNVRISRGLREAGFDVILPQERGQERIRPGEPLPVRGLYEYALDGIRQADVVVAVLDGPDPDSGTSFEWLRSRAAQTRHGLRTDFPLGGDDVTEKDNLMLSQAAHAFVHVASDNP